MNYIKGDLITLFKKRQFDSIAHQCNCFKMGAGVAGQLTNEFPNLKQVLQVDPQLLPGTYCAFITRYGHIFNLFSQYKPGACTKTGLDSFDMRLYYLATCVYNIAKNEPAQKLGIPLIASGIAADVNKKKNMTDLTYFQTYIAERFFPLEQNGWQITVVVYE